MSVESINAVNAAGAAGQSLQQTQQTQTQQPVTDSVVQQPAEAAAQEAPQQKLTNEEASALAERLNEFMNTKQRNLAFSVDEESNDTIIKVLDSETQEVIRQYPSEEAVELAKHLEAAMGLIFNDKA
ncbi:flagellar protein FlaG [Aliamphritea hakodatensis]|uniref:flagellar protein FlaG n=1 Tax=Aliamphritea hakodatensis TaxID=2895352 RepID=UPI0022FD7562|nr:flagellar protein FlaG [Aliamphritea hakodatensis]